MLPYNFAVSGNCYKVRLLLAHLGIDYETVAVSVVDHSNRKELLGIRARAAGWRRSALSPMAPVRTNSIVAGASRRVWGGPRGISRR
jgi:glutathione S-transferase